MQKLALYAHGKQRVELEDVAAVVTDASALALDALVDATFAGKLADVEFQYTKARNAGTSAGAILFGVARHARAAAQGAARGRRRTVGQVRGRGDVAAFQPRAAGASRARAWPAPRLQAAIGQIADATLQSRLNADLSEAIVQRLLLSMAMSARRKD